MVVPKESGGLGFTDTWVMNTCLLVKWIFKLERGNRNMCYDMLRKKYLQEKSFFNCEFAIIERAHNIRGG